MCDLDAYPTGTHADRGGPVYSDETVIVSVEMGTIYRIGGDTLALRHRGVWTPTGQ